MLTPSCRAWSGSLEAGSSTRVDLSSPFLPVTPSPLSPLSLSVCRFLSDPGFPSSLSLQYNSYVLLSWGSISLFPSFSRVSFPSPLLFGFVGFNALVGVKDLLVGGWVEREFPEMSLKLLRFSSSSSLSFSSSTFLLLFLFLFHESSSFGLIII